MKLTSFSVSDLETFRRYRMDEDMELSDVLRSIRREEEPSINMRAGTALHSILETSDAGSDLTTMERDGFTFNFSLETSIELHPIREVRGQRQWIIDGEAVELRGRVDGMDGVAIDDHKLTSHFDASRYLDSIQWRAYLAIFGAQVFNYNAFVGKQDKDDPMRWEVVDLHRLRVYTYPELERDVESELRMFAAFARDHRLYSLKEVA